MSDVPDSSSFNLGLANIASQNYGPAAGATQAVQRAQAQNLQQQSQAQAMENKITAARMPWILSGLHVQTGEPETEVPLIRLAWARSGDKGDISNIGLVARRAEWLPLLWARVTPEVVKAYFAHLVHGRVERFHLPGIDAMNLVMHEALGGGGPASTRNDPLTSNAGNSSISGQC